LEPTPGVELGLAGLRDVDQILELEKASFGDDAYGRSVFLFYMATDRDGFIVARRGAGVVGYVLAIRRGRRGLIMSIAVLPEFKRKGIGTSLMKAALAQLSKCANVFLQVDVANEGAIKFYRRLGFAETGRVHPRYYPNGHDAVEMARET
jgi:ribosomal-protein-alanine N-acetyltransferase